MMLFKRNFFHDKKVQYEFYQKAQSTRDFSHERYKSKKNDKTKEVLLEIASILIRADYLARTIF